MRPAFAGANSGEVAGGDFVRFLARERLEDERWRGDALAQLYSGQRRERQKARTPKSAAAANA